MITKAAHLWWRACCPACPSSNRARSASLPGLSFATATLFAMLVSLAAITNRAVATSSRPSGLGAGPPAVPGAPAVLGAEAAAAFNAAACEGLRGGLVLWPLPWLLVPLPPSVAGAVVVEVEEVVVTSSRTSRELLPTQVTCGVHAGATDAMHACSPHDLTAKRPP